MKPSEALLKGCEMTSPLIGANIRLRADGTAACALGAMHLAIFNNPSRLIDKDVETLVEDITNYYHLEDDKRRIIAQVWLINDGALGRRRMSRKQIADWLQVQGL